MYLSDFGKKLAEQSGIQQLMDDLGQPIPVGVKAYQLGGGNPARVPDVEKAYRLETEKLLADAVIKYEAKQYNEAISIFDKVLSMTPSNATVYYYRAMAYDAISNYEKAISDYKTTLKHAPDMTIAYYSLGVDYEAINNYQLAKENFKKYIDLTIEENDYKTYAKSRVQEIQ